LLTKNKPPENALQPVLSLTIKCEVLQIHPPVPSFCPESEKISYGPVIHSHIYLCWVYWTCHTCPNSPVYYYQSASCYNRSSHLCISRVECFGWIIPTL